MITRPPTGTSHLLATPAYSYLTARTSRLLALFFYSRPSPTRNHAYSYLTSARNSRLLALHAYSHLAATHNSRLFAPERLLVLLPNRKFLSTRTSQFTRNLCTFARWPLSFLGVWGLGVAARQTALDTVPLGDASDAWVRELPTTPGRQPLTLPDGNASGNVLRVKERFYFGIPTRALDFSLAPSVLHN